MIVSVFKIYGSNLNAVEAFVNTSEVGMKNSLYLYFRTGGHAIISIKI